MSTPKKAKTTAVALAAARKNMGRSRQEIIKPSELISAKPIAGRTLSLPAAKAYNLMLGVAQAAGFAEGRYSITKKALRGSHKGNERIAGLMDELHSIAFQARGQLAGKTGTWRFNLLAPTFEEDGDEDTGSVYFSFPPELLEIIAASGTWAVLLTKAMAKFESLYALRLYEEGCGIVTRNEPFLWLTPTTLREKMQVPEDAYRDWTDLNRYVLQKAITEVNQLAHFDVGMPAESIRRQGRKVVKFLLTFTEKSKGNASKAESERDRHSAGRKARRDGDIEHIVPHDATERAAKKLASADLTDRQRWYDEARKRGAREIKASTAPTNIHKWVAWVAVDVLAAKDLKELPSA